MSTVEVGVSIEEEGVTVDTAHRPLPSKSTKGDSLDSSGWQAGTLAAVLYGALSRPSELRDARTSHELPKHETDATASVIVAR